MNSERKQSTARKAKRAMRNRKRLRGNAIKPRLSVFKSNKHLYAQLIDDENGVTLASASTVSKELRSTEHNRKNKGSAKVLGAAIAEDAIKKNIKEIIFDRGPFKYHGVLAELADAAREKGLAF